MSLSNPIAAQLRVAMLAPISWRVPPRHYGPWEQFVSLLTEGLVERGLDVTLFASADSITAARLVGTIPTGYSEDPDLDAKVWEGLHIATVFERAGEFDLIHNSFDFLPLTYSGLVETPVVTTIHGFSSERILPVYERYDDRALLRGHQRRRPPPEARLRGDDPPWHRHGAVPLRTTPGDYLLFFGRIHPEKGAAEAIEVARRAGVPLTIAGIVQDEAYFRESVEPRVDGKRVSYIGPRGARHARRAARRGTCPAALIDFEEPFGFSVVEAMACGTPVIANRRGSMPEIVSHAENGYLVDSLEQAVDAVELAAHLDRTAVRASVEDRFSVSRMVDEYASLYRRVVADHAG